MSLYNVIKDNVFVGRVRLGPRNAVLRTDGTVVNGDKHTCGDEKNPRHGEELHLKHFGREQGFDLKGHGKFDETRPGFFHNEPHVAEKVLGNGDWLATDDGTIVKDKDHRRANSDNEKAGAMPSNVTVRKTQVGEKIEVNGISYIAKWIPLLKGEGPYNVGLDEDCGAIFLGPNHTVEAAVFVAPNAALKRVLIPDAMHTCVDHKSPQQKDCLYLESYGDAFGEDFREYVGVYDATDPLNPGRFLFKAKPKRWGQGEYVAKDDGTQ